MKQGKCLLSYYVLLTWCFKKTFQDIGLPLLCIKLVWSDPIRMKKMTRDCKFKRWLMRPCPIPETSNKSFLNLLMKISLLGNLSTWANVEMRMSVSNVPYMTERGKSDIRALVWSDVFRVLNSSYTPLTVMVFVCGAFWIRSVPKRSWTRCLLASCESNSFISSWFDGSLVSQSITFSTAVFLIFFLLSLDFAVPFAFLAFLVDLLVDFFPSYLSPFTSMNSHGRE